MQSGANGLGNAIVASRSHLSSRASECGVGCLPSPGEGLEPRLNLLLRSNLPKALRLLALSSSGGGGGRGGGSSCSRAAGGGGDEPGVLDAKVGLAGAGVGLLAPVAAGLAVVAEGAVAAQTHRSNGGPLVPLKEEGCKKRGGQSKKRKGQRVVFQSDQRERDKQTSNRPSQQLEKRLRGGT